MPSAPPRRPPFAVRVHRHFVNLFFVVMVLAALRGDDGSALLRTALGFAATAAALLLHELAHAIVARRLGLIVDEVVIHPLGGAAKMLLDSDDPRVELKVAAAGPAVNLLIAGLGYGAIAAFGGEGDASWLLRFFLFVNVVLGTWNLLPAFPTDGGRMLRASLMRRRSKLQATRLAVSIGRRVATLLFVAPFVAVVVADVPWPFLVAGPATAGAIFVLGSLELLRVEAEAARSAFGGPGGPGGFGGFGNFGVGGSFGSSSSPPPGESPEGPFLDVEGKSRVVD
jgi:Zn-dependent protease